jgi:hypothetical protein
MGKRGNGEGSIQRRKDSCWMRRYPFCLSPAYNTSPKLFVVILRALEAICAGSRFKDAYKAAVRIGESVRKRPIERFISQAQQSELTGV